MNEKIIERAVKLSEYTPGSYTIILSGGYKNKDGVTEARSMENYLLSLCPDRKYIRENKSYRTHNNAIEALKIVKSQSGGKWAQVIVVDHPKHITRTFLSFQMVNHAYYHDKYDIMWWAGDEVYDPNIPGQEYWASRESFKKHEKNGMILYKFLLFRPWARIGLWLLKTVWPSEKQ